MGRDPVHDALCTMKNVRNLLNSLLGRAALPAPADSEKIFAINTAYVELQARLFAEPTGFAALAFQRVEASMFGRLEGEIEELVRHESSLAGAQAHITQDKFGYAWLLLRDSEFERLVASMHLASSTLELNGFDRALLAAVFEFTIEGQIIYWLYNFKRGMFYPFVPKANRERDTVLELRLKSLMSQELPIDPDTSRWYPLWDIPRE
jgi:hypothetical protein